MGGTASCGGQGTSSAAGLALAGRGGRVGGTRGAVPNPAGLSEERDKDAADGEGEGGGDVCALDVEAVRACMRLGSRGDGGSEEIEVKGKAGARG